MEQIMHFLEHTPLTHLPYLIIVGIIAIVGIYAGKLAKFAKLPSIIGFMVLGVILGPSLLNMVSTNSQESLSFLTEMALGFVALSIGLELKISTLKEQGKAIIIIILVESFGTFFVVTSSIYLLTQNLPMALIFGAIAPASAPAGTVAVIHEYKTRGPLTNALYAVVGFDDGLAIIIYGFAAAISHSILLHQTGGGSMDLVSIIMVPLKEIGMSITLGVIAAAIFALLSRKINNSQEMFILIFGVVLLVTGISSMFHLSLILTNMIVGMFIINTQPKHISNDILRHLPDIMPLLFILFFTMAGTGLHLAAIPALGILGIVYIFARTAGLIGGATIGARLGKAAPTIRKYIGLGILSQAGVAIGLALAVKHDFRGIGRIVDTANGVSTSSGDQLGTIVITSVTATCIFFEIIGPILTKIALTKAGEINKM